MIGGKPLEVFIGMTPKALEEALERRFGAPFQVSYRRKPYGEIIHIQNMGTLHVFMIREPEVESATNKLERVIERIISRTNREEFDNVAKSTRGRKIRSGLADRRVHGVSFAEYLRMGFR